MRDYVIYTDSACDISRELLDSWGVFYSELTFKFASDTEAYRNGDMPIEDFYQRMRSGETATTSAINPETFFSEFEKIISRGKDILYIGFSSGLSATYNCARLAAENIKSKYPLCRIIAIDTLAASAGEGLLLKLVVDKKSGGASIEDAASYAKSLIPHICHWFTVDDLVYLKRGGRISPVAAFLGNVIGIKPVLHVDDEGHLVNVLKVRGRRYSIEALAKKYGEYAEEENGTVFISHADCIDDANKLANILKLKYGVSVEIITDVGTVIGAHSGPGTLALFFVGKKR